MPSPAGPVSPASSLPPVAGPRPLPEAPAAELIQIASASARGYRIDIRNEPAFEHVRSLHINRTPQQLIQRLNDNIHPGRYTVYLRETGSFSSIQSANRLINATLSANHERVQQLVDGQGRNRISLFAEFSSPTGIAAQRGSIRSQPTVGDVYNVQVVIQRDTNAANGFRIVTAFPTTRNGSEPGFRLEWPFLR